MVHHRIWKLCERKSHAHRPPGPAQSRIKLGLDDEALLAGQVDDLRAITTNMSTNKPGRRAERRASITDAIMEGLNEDFFDEFAADDFDAQKWAEQARARLIVPIS